MICNTSAGFGVCSEVSSRSDGPGIPKGKQTGGILMVRPGHLNGVLSVSRGPEVPTELLIFTLQMNPETSAEE